MADFENFNGKHADEAKLIERLKEGDSKAWERFVDIYSRKLYYRVKKLSRDLTEQDVEDIVAETFKKFIVGIENFREECSIDTYLCRIASNLYSSIERAKGAKKRPDKKITDIPERKFNNIAAGQSHEMSLNGIDITSTSTSSLTPKQSMILHSAFRELKQEYKEVLVLKIIKCYSAEEIIEYFFNTIGRRVTEQTIYNWNIRGKRSMRKLLIKKGFFTSGVTDKEGGKS